MPNSASDEAARKRLLALGKRDKDGILRSEVVLEDATPPTAILHDRFTWDDAVAGHNYRLGEASELIQRYYIQVAPAPKKPIRQFTYVPTQRGYIHTPQLKTEKDVAQEVAQRMVSEVRDIVNRNENFFASFPSLKPYRELMAKIIALGIL